MFKINTFDKDTFRLLKAASVSEQELSDELAADAQRHLLEPQSRTDKEDDEFTILSCNADSFCIKLFHAHPKVDCVLVCRFSIV